LNKDSKYLKLSIYILIYIFFNATLVFFFLEKYKFCLSSSVISGLMLIFKVGNELYFKNKKYFNFGSLLIICALIFKFFGLLQVLIYTDSLDTWPFVITDSFTITNIQRLLCVLQGDWLSVLGTILVSLSWFHFGGVELTEKIKKNVEISGSKNIYWVLYFCAIFMEFISILVPLPSIYILILTLYFGALFAVIMICNLYKKDVSKHKLLLAVFLLLPYLYNSFKTGMKESMIIALIPVIIDFYFRFGSITKKIILSFIGAFVFVGFSIFSNVTRAISWGSDRSVGLIELISNFKSQFKNVEADFIFANLEQALKRITPLFYQGWTISLNYTDIKLSGLFTNVFTLLVPRFLWSGKPLNNPEYEMTVIFYGPEIAKSTSEASGLYSEIFIKEGSLIFILTCIFLGWVIAKLQKISLSYGNHLTASVFNFILLFSTLRFHEFYFTALFPGLLIKFIYIFAYCFAINLFFKKFTSKL